MAEIVNLRSARKARAREQARVAADANRALHGRTRAEKARDARAADRLASIVEGAKIERD